jgi:3-deoxy-D-manno-octulosonic-acid transferase
MLAGRLPLGVIHQYMPVDRMPYVRAFLDHWRPDLALWIESELWPNMLAEIRARKIPAVLLNGAMSEESFRNWSRMRGWAKEILATFDLCLAQTEADRSRLAALGARSAKCAGNLKYAGQPLPYDENTFTPMKAAIGKRPIWLMASTHPGEEEMALAVHRKLREKWPEILTLIVPRHARRGDEIALKLVLESCSFAQRSKNESVTPGLDIYLADTMGELGLFYRLSPIAVIGGSFTPVGGHNLIEPAQLDCAIVLGPYMSSFSEIAAEFVEHEAAVLLRDAGEIADAVDRFLGSPEARDRTAYAARMLAEQKRHVLDEVIKALEPWLGSPADANSSIPAKTAHA